MVRLEALFECGALDKGEFSWAVMRVTSVQTGIDIELPR